jgi:hypothetical protein
MEERDMEQEKQNGKKNEHYIHKDCKKKKLGKCEVNNFNTEIIKNILLFFIVHTSVSVKF